MAEALQIAPVRATFGAVVSGVKLAEIDRTTWQSVYTAWLQHALLIFPGQHFTRQQQVEFARRFGTLEFAIAPISNVKADGSLRDGSDDDVVKVLKGNMFWHADSTYMPIQAKGAVFSAEVVPNAGGETEWADMRAAYDALDTATLQKVEALSAYHSLRYSQSKLGHSPNEGSEYSGYGFHDGPLPLRPLVKTHPETGRKSLLIGRHAHNILGMEKAESESFLEALVDFACQAPRVYRHRWTPGDVVIWDNRCLLHRAMPWNMKEPRIMWHSRIAGDPLSEAALS